MPNQCRQPTPFFVHVHRRLTCTLLLSRSQEKPTARLDRHGFAELRRTSRLKAELNQPQTLDANAQAQADSAAWSADALPSRRVPLAAGAPPRLKGGFAEVKGHAFSFLAVAFFLLGFLNTCVTGRAFFALCFSPGACSGGKRSVGSSPLRTRAPTELTLHMAPRPPSKCPTPRRRTRGV